MITGLAAGDLMTGNDPVMKNSKTYTVENEETGETKKVTARNSEDLGKKISKGRFDD